jgi:membrane-bound lytic murein transglycosylase
VGVPRADLYWGTGAVAGDSAGLMKGMGRLWLLQPRP